MMVANDTLLYNATLVLTLYAKFNTKRDIIMHIVLIYGCDNFWLENDYLHEQTIAETRIILDNVTKDNSLILRS